LTHDRATTARHEGGHVASLLLDGRLPKRVSADWPRAGSSGVTEPDWGEGVTRESAMDVAVCILCGPLAEERDDWPPAWLALDADDESQEDDARQLAICAGYLALSEADWHALVGRAQTRVATPEFQRLAGLVARALELKDEITAQDLRDLLGDELLRKYGIPTTTRSTPMLHKQVDATATPTTEAGTAILLVAAYSRDRGGDVIQRGAFRHTIAAWRASGKRVPLAWNHETGKAEQIIGSVDPATMSEQRDGLRAEASLDLEGSATAREAWRLVSRTRSEFRLATWRPRAIPVTGHGC
jgi:hypothetical protein